MKTAVRINSTIKNGIGGAESGHLELIYMHLLTDYNQDFYTHIGINQIGEEVDEIILKEGKKIYINIKYPLPSNFAAFNTDEKNGFSLDLVHEALMRLAVQEKKLVAQVLEKIYTRIQEASFSFHFLCKEYRNKANSEVTVKILVEPKANEFRYFLAIQSNNRLNCELYLFSGLSIPFIEQDVFYKAVWKSATELNIHDRDNQLEFLIETNGCKFEVNNLTNYSNPPRFTMFRTDVTQKQREQAKLDWEHSLPPAVAAIIRQADN